jgi:4-nitrophenyl phosphatase
MTTLLLAFLRGLIIDVDGVLWRGSRPMPGVAAFFDFLRTHRIPFIIATNNAMRPALDIVDRLTAMNVHVNEREVLTSSDATALYLSRVAPRGARVLVVGGEGLLGAMARAGFQIVEQEADVVVAGLDMELTYDKLRLAALEIRRGAKFIGTNADPTLPSAEGDIPGAGAIIAALRAATDVAPLVIGKPERAMFDIAVEKLGAARAATAMLGDRLDTDIEGAQNAGLQSILVLTGVTTREALAQSRIQPGLTFENLDALREAWGRAY